MNGLGEQRDDHLITLTGWRESRATGMTSKIYVPFGTDHQLVYIGTTLKVHVGNAHFVKFLNVKLSSIIL